MISFMAWENEVRGYTECTRIWKFSRSYMCVVMLPGTQIIKEQWLK